MDESKILGYQRGDSAIHRINATAKLFFLIVVSIACMTTFDTRFLIFIALLSLVLFKISGIKWYQVAFVVKFITVFSLLNVVAIFVFQPGYGTQLYGAEHVLLHAGYFTITSQELFYLFNVAIKYICTVPLALLFLLTTNPSLFASSLNQIGVSYKVSYAVSLALRYIPDIQTSYWNISAAQQARGIELSKKANLWARIKGTLNIVTPLILSSLDRIETVSTAMQLRRFGSKKKRTWYRQQPIKIVDVIIIVIAGLLFGLTLYLFKLNGGRFYNPWR